MKRLMAWICISMLTFMIAVYPRSDVRAGSNDDKAKKASTLYSVKVQVKEAKNRIVEGKVRNHTLRIDQPTAFGGDNTAATPPETLAFAIGSCIVSTGRLIAIQRKLDIQAIEAMVEGELDFANALGISREKRAGYSGFKITMNIDADISKKKLIDEISSRCPLCDNIQHATPISYGLAE